MWVRSKLGSKLIDCHGFGISKSTKWEILGLTTVQIEKLGEYETRARALEVLDEIESTLRKGYSYDSMQGKNRYFKEVIYKMPEE